MAIAAGYQFFALSHEKLTHVLYGLLLFVDINSATVKK